MQSRHVNGEPSVPGPSGLKPVLGSAYPIAIAVPRAQKAFGAGLSGSSEVASARVTQNRYRSPSRRDSSWPPRCQFVQSPRALIESGVGPSSRHLLTPCCGSSDLKCKQIDSDPSALTMSSRTEGA